MSARQPATGNGGSTRQDAQRLGPWFHNLHLPDGTETAPDHPLGDFPRFKWEQIAPHVPEDLTGWTALDVGCNAGYYAFELAKRGATVTGIDVDPRYLKQARWAAEQFGVQDRVTFERKQVYDLAREDAGRYDLVLFLGVLYHLRYPLLGLDAVARVTGKRLVFQSLMVPGEDVEEDTSDRGIHDREALKSEGWPRVSFIEHAFAGDPSNWWVPNRAAVEAMLRSSGLAVVARPEAETFVCEPDPDLPVVTDSWNRTEFLSATGARWKDEDAGDAKVTKFRAAESTLESAHRR